MKKFLALLTIISIFGVNSVQATNYNPPTNIIGPVHPITPPPPVPPSPNPPSPEPFSGHSSINGSKNNNSALTAVLIGVGVVVAGIIIYNLVDDSWTTNEKGVVYRF